MSIKPLYLFLYKTDGAIDDLLSHQPFCYETPIVHNKSREGAFIEYEHFTIRCMRESRIDDNLRGLRACQILVERCLYDKITMEQIECILRPMLIDSILGGRIVSV